VLKLSKFQDKLHKAQTQRATNRVLWLLPQLKWLPLPIQRYDDPFLPYGKAIVDATRDLVCGYGFSLAAYLAIGAAGAVALERTIAYVRADNLSVSILDGAFAGRGYIEAAGESAFNVDAVTLMSEASIDAYEAAGIGALVVHDGLGEALERAGMHLIGLDVVFKAQGDDFAEQIRATLQP
jgi:hypothetical protein